MAIRTAMSARRVATASQQQVGDICAGNQQNEGGEDHEHLESEPGLLLEALDAAAGGNDDYVLLGDHRRSTVIGVDRTRVKPVAESLRQFGLKRTDVCAGTHPPDRVEPVGIGMMQDGACPADIRFAVNRDPEASWAISNTIAEENPGGAMPTTVNGWVWIEMGQTRRLRDRRKTSVCQRAVAGEPQPVRDEGVSSASLKTRPL